MKIPLFGAILGALLTISTITAQNAGPGPDRQRPGGPQRPGGGPGLGAAAMEGLTEEQRTAVRDEMQAMNQASRDLREKQRTAQSALRDAVFAEKIDESAIRAKAAEVGKIEGDLAVIRAKHMANLRGKLPAEAFARIKESPMGMGGGGGMAPGAGGLRRGPGDGQGQPQDGERPRRQRQQPQ